MTDSLGFTSGTFAFLRELAENNNTAWFDAHRETYDKHVREPFITTLEALTESTAAGPWPLRGGRETMFRINRDIRFSDDKSPYHTYVSGLLTPDGDKTPNGGVTYLHLEPGSSTASCGYYRLSATQLGVIRDRMLDDAEEFDEVLRVLRARGRTLSSEDSLTSMPRGYASQHDHRHAKYLRLRTVASTVKITQTEWIRGDVVDKVNALISDCAPLMTFVGRVP